MKIGLSAYDIHAAELVDLAVAGDELGFSSLWLGEHIILPVGYGSTHPTTGDTAHAHLRSKAIIDPDTILLDPLVALAGVASRTKQIRLATGIYLLPLRPALITARMTATLQDLAGGRFMLGVGSGWLEEEFDAVGVPFGERRARYEEALEILRKAWSGEELEHDGQFVQTGRVRLGKEPVKVPLILGGNTDPAMRRAARLADGWFSSGTPSMDDAKEMVARLRGHLEAAGRRDPFQITVRMGGADGDVADRYRAEGFEEILVWIDSVWPREGSLTQKEAALAAAADRLGVTRS